MIDFKLESKKLDESAPQVMLSRMARQATWRRSMEPRCGSMQATGCAMPSLPNKTPVIYLEGEG